MTIEATIASLLEGEGSRANPGNERNNVDKQTAATGGTSKKANRVTQGAIPAETMAKLQNESYDDLTEDEIALLDELAEDVDQLDELSKATLGSYIKNASHDVATRGAATRQFANDEQKARDDEDYREASRKKQMGDKMFAKSWKRREGMAKAVDRLTKEDFNMGEEEQLRAAEQQGAKMKESFDMTEDVQALFNGEDGLTEEFRQKAETIFEAAVTSRIKQEVAAIEEAYEAAYAQALEEAVQEQVEGLVEHVDGYLNLMAQAWMEENEIALVSGVKNEIMESFIGGMKNLFQEHYIEVPEEKFDLVQSMEEQVADLNARLDEAVAMNARMYQSLCEGARAEIVAEATQGLSALETERLQDLAEEIQFDTAETFAKKIHTIRETYFSKKPAAVSAPAFLQEETIHEEVKHVPSEMQAYVKTIATLNR